MKARFLGVPGEHHDSINMWGQIFALGRDMAVSHLSAVIQRKLKQHPHFKTTGGDAEDIAYNEKNDTLRDEATALAALTGDHEIATAELQGKEPAPNAKEGLVDQAANIEQTKIDKRRKEHREQK